MSQIFFYLKHPNPVWVDLQRKITHWKDYRWFSITRRPGESGSETRQLEHHPLLLGHSTQPGAVKIPPSLLRIRCHHLTKATVPESCTLVTANVALRTSSCCLPWSSKRIMPSLHFAVSGSQFIVQGIFNLYYQGHGEKQRKYLDLSFYSERYALIPTQ